MCNTQHTRHARDVPWVFVASEILFFAIVYGLCVTAQFIPTIEVSLVPSYFVK